MKRQLRVGLAGIAALYWPVMIAEGIRARRDAKLVAFSTLGLAPRVIKDHVGMEPDEFARSCGAARYEDLDDMLRTEDLDAVAVCSRHTEHAALVPRIAAHGRDIFIAKTFATTARDAEAICAAGRKHGVRIAVGPSARFLPWFAAAKRVVDAGEIGAPFSMHVAHHHGTIDVFGPGDSYRDTREGGPELSLGWYLVDLVMHFMAKPVAGVSAVYGTYTSPDSPFMDCGKMTLTLEGGAMASCDMYFCNRFDYPRWEMEIIGEKGALLVRQSGDQAAVSVSTPRGTRAVALPSKTRDWELFWIDDFRAGREPELSAEYARRVTAACLAARDAARRGRWIAVPAARKAP